MSHHPSPTSSTESTVPRLPTRTASGDKVNSTLRDARRDLDKKPGAKRFGSQPTSPKVEDTVEVQVARALSSKGKGKRKERAVEEGGGDGVDTATQGADGGAGGKGKGKEKEPQAVRRDSKDVFPSFLGDSDPESPTHETENIPACPKTKWSHDWDDGTKKCRDCGTEKPETGTLVVVEKKGTVMGGVGDWLKLPEGMAAKQTEGGSSEEGSERGEGEVYDENTIGLAI